MGWRRKPGSGKTNSHLSHRWVAPVDWVPSKLTVGALVLTLVGSTVAQATPTSTVRLETGPAVDSNVARVEGRERDSDLLTRLRVDLQLAAPVSTRVRFKGAYLAGAKRFYTLTAEDMLSQRLKTELWMQLARGLLLGAEGSLKDRTTRAPKVSRDYTRYGGSLLLVGRLSSTVLTLRGHTEQFMYAVDQRQSARGLGGSARLTQKWGAAQLSLGGTRIERRYDGPPKVLGGESGSDIVVWAPSGHRFDVATRYALSARYVSAWIGHLAYAYEHTDSNSYGGRLGRHTLRGTATFPLVGPWVVSSGVTIQWMRYRVPQQLDVGTRDPNLLLSEESRPGATLRVARPLWSDWSVALHGGIWLSPYGGGPEYLRQIAGLALVYSRDR